MVDEAEKGKSKDSDQEELEDKTKTAEVVDEMGEMVEAVEKKGLELQMRKGERKEKRRGLPAATKRQKRKQKNDETGENCVRGRVDWFDGR